MVDGLYIVEPDKHIKYECPRYSALLYKLIAIHKPQGFINMGDLIDCPQVSRHDKDPRKMDQIEVDIARGNAHLDTIEREMPRGGTIHLLEGNHEKRIQKYAFRHAQGLISIVPEWSALYDIKGRNKRKCSWTWHPLDIWDHCKIGPTIFHHGFYYDKNVAVSNLDRYCSRGLNFVQGHTHRVQWAHNDHNWSASIGHAGDARKLAHNPTPNDWQQAVSFYTVYKGDCSLEIFKVENGAAMVRGKLVKG